MTDLDAAAFQASRQLGLEGDQPAYTVDIGDETDSWHDYLTADSAENEEKRILMVRKIVHQTANTILEIFHIEIQ
jgi:hypothetical protein